MACVTMGAWADPTYVWRGATDGVDLKCEVIDGSGTAFNVKVVEVIFYSNDVTTVTIPASFEKNSNTYTITTIGTGGTLATSTGSEITRAKSDITTLNISEGITTIAGWCFNEWSGLTSVSLPSTLTTINGEAFASCSSLPAINIPTNVSTLGANIFQNCTALTSITINSIASSFDSWAFAKINDGSSQKFNDNTTIYAPFKIIKQLNNTTDGKLKDYTGTGLAYNALNVVLDEAEDIKSYGSIDVHVKTGETFTVKRTLHRGYWNTICLPVDVDWTAWDAQLGTGWKLCTFTGCTENVMTFNSVSQVPGKNVPYLLWVPTKAEENTIAELTFTAVAGTYLQIWDANPSTDKNPYYMTGNMNGVEQKVPNGALFIANDKVYKSTGNSPMKAMSAYFTVPSGGSARSFTFSVDGEPTGIISIGRDGSVNVEQNAVYDLQGRRIAQPKHGLYIVNGKKVIIK